MKLKNFPMIFCSALTLSLVLALSLPYSSYSKHNPPPESDDRGGGDELQDQDGGHRHDPCERALRGKAFERDRRCPPVGSSSGIARGDFNGDGAPDLAVGIPGKDVISGFPRSVRCRTPARWPLFMGYWISLAIPSS